MLFGEKFKTNILRYFPKIFSRIFIGFGQKQLILHDFSKLKKKTKKKKPLKMEKLGRSHR